MNMATEVAAALKLMFDVDKHRYTYDNEMLPSVTEIIRMIAPMPAINPFVLVRATAFGTAVHRMIQFRLKETLDYAALDTEVLLPMLMEFDKIWAASGFTAVALEKPLAHPLYRYAGTPDILALTPKGVPAVIDIKTGSFTKTVGLQTAAYAELSMNHVAEAVFKKGKIKRYVLHATQTGMRLKELSDLGDWTVFLSALNVWRWKSENL